MVMRLCCDIVVGLLGLRGLCDILVHVKSLDLRSRMLKLVAELDLLRLDELPGSSDPVFRIRLSIVPITG